VKRTTTWAAVFLAMFLWAGDLGAQRQSVPAGPPPAIPPPSADDDDKAKIERDMRKRANTERQQQIQRDTDRLLQLATELKQAVDKSNEDTLSLDVIKKAEEVERLAHSVKEKMRGNY